MEHKNLYSLFSCNDKEELYNKVINNSDDVLALSDFINYAKGNLITSNARLQSPTAVFSYITSMNKPTPNVMRIIGVDTQTVPLIITSVNIKNKNGLKNSLADLLEANAANCFVFYHDKTDIQNLEKVKKSLNVLAITVLDTFEYNHTSNVIKSIETTEASRYDFYKTTRAHIPKIKNTGLSQAQGFDEFMSYYAKNNLRHKNIMTERNEIEELLKLGFQHNSREVFACVLYDKNNKIIDTDVVFQGGTDKTVVDPRVLYKHVMSYENVQGVIAMHNHPSGSQNPSQEDILLTKRLALGAESLGFEFCDHLIITKSGVHSIIKDSVAVDLFESHNTVEAGEVAYNYEIKNNEGKKKAAIKNDVSPMRYLNDKMLLSLEQENDNRGNAPLPFLPNDKGVCNVKAVKDVNGYELTGIQQLAAKMYLHERGMDNDNICTFMQATKHRTAIKAGEKGFWLPAYDKEHNKTKAVRYFAESQTYDKEKFPYVATNPIKTNAIFKQKSSNPQDYITNYLKCVHENRPFTAEKDVVQGFKQELIESIKQEPTTLYKICNQAAKQIRESASQNKDKPKEIAKQHEAIER